MDATKPPQTDCANSRLTLTQLSPAKQQKAMDRFWNRMAGIYGADVWCRRYPTEAIEQWAQALGRFTLEEVGHAIERCEADDSGRVPTLGQFVGMCKTHPARVAQRYEAPLPTVEAFLAHEPDSDVGRYNIGLMRRIWKGEPVKRSELEALPPTMLHDGTRVRAVDVYRNVEG